MSCAISPVGPERMSSLRRVTYVQHCSVQRGRRRPLDVDHLSEQSPAFLIASLSKPKPGEPLQDRGFDPAAGWCEVEALLERSLGPLELSLGQQKMPKIGQHGHAHASVTRRFDELSGSLRLPKCPLEFGVQVVDAQLRDGQRALQIVVGMRAEERRSNTEVLTRARHEISLRLNLPDVDVQRGGQVRVAGRGHIASDLGQHRQ